MKVKSQAGPPNKVTFKTKDVREGNQLVKWWMTKNTDKMAGEMLTTAAYLKETQGQRYRNSAIFARLYGNQNLYSFAGSNIAKMDRESNLPIDRPTFNLVQAIIDTLVSRVGQTRPKPIFLTDGANYKQRNLAKKLNNFIQGEFYNTHAYETAIKVLRDAMVMGTGVCHTFETPDGRVGLERVLCTELLVDPNEALYGEPRRIYRLKLMDRDVLLANFPKLKDKIEMAAQAYPDNSADASKTVSDLVMVVEAWSLPSGKGMKDGRHTIACTAGSLIDEVYEKDKFPFTFLHYADRMTGFWAQGVAERQMGTQTELNSILYTISRAIKLVGVPRVFQEDGSKVMSASHNNEIGVIVKFRGTKPSYEVAPCNAPELYAERDKLIQYGFQAEGMSMLQATSQKPAGLNSGEAIRSYEDIATDRFASFARKYDNFFMDLAYQQIDLAMDISIRDGEYSTVYPNKNGTQEVDLPKAGLIKDSFIIQCFTQSSLPKDPAGRLAKVTEMMQAGLVSLQEGRRLLDFPDLEQIEQLANAAEERIYSILDGIIEDGKRGYQSPEPEMDLEIADKIVVQYINLYAPVKLEDSKMQLLRDFRAQVQALITHAMSPAAQSTPNGQAAPTPLAVPQAPPVSPMLPNAGGAPIG